MTLSTARRRGVALAVVAALALSLLGAPVGAQGPPLGPAELAPSGLEVSLVGNRVTLAWQAPASDAASVTGYEILRRRPKQGERALAALVADTESADTAYTDHSADEAGVRYTYRVKALRGGDKSRWSNFARIDLPADYDPHSTPDTDDHSGGATTGDAQPAPAYCDETDTAWQEADLTPGIAHVETLVLSNVTHDSVTLEWTAPAGDAPLGYVIVRRNNGGTYEIAHCTMDPSQTSHTDSGLEPETEYTYWVSAIRPTGVTLISHAATASATTMSLQAASATATATNGICERTPQVRDAILGVLPQVTDCASVTEAHLDSVGYYLDLTNTGVTGLKAGDFDGLTNLAHLSFVSNDLKELPDGVFDGLQGLLTLSLSGNELEELPHGVFDNLTNLTTLYLNHNELENLSDGVFDSLTNLESLHLHGNSLDALPHGVFDKLSKLRFLYLDGNGLDALPHGVFDNLSNLESLHLHDNDLYALPEGVFDGASDLERLYLYGNPGTPFVVGTELERPDDQTAVVKVALGAPFDMEVTLSAQGATLSTDTVTVDAGSSISDAVDVTPDGNGLVTIDITSVAFVLGQNDEARGIRSGIGPTTPPVDPTPPPVPPVDPTPPPVPPVDPPPPPVPPVDPPPAPELGPVDK